MCVILNVVHTHMCVHVFVRVCMACSIGDSAGPLYLFHCAIPIIFLFVSILDPVKQRQFILRVFLILTKIQVNFNYIIVHHIAFPASLLAFQKIPGAEVRNK